jgi:predicted exporter
MNTINFSTVQALSIAGSTLAVGVVLGWVLALLYLGNSSAGSNHREKED